MKLASQLAIIISFVLSEGLLAQGQEHGASARMQYEIQRLSDPSTGKIPMDMRLKELAFAQTLPKGNFNNEVSLRGTPWYHRGPFNIGGRTRALGIDAANENRIIAGSVSGGMWLSNDGGKSWHPTQQTNELRSATCLAQDIRKNHQNVWIMGSGEAYGQSAGSSGAYYLGDGLFISTDSGKSWKPISSTAAGVPTAFSTAWQLVWNVAIDPSANDTSTVIYAAVYNNLMRSADGGKTWKSVKVGASYFTDVAVTSNGTVYFTMSSDGVQRGIWKSTNGIDFVNITPANFGSKYNRIVIGIDPQNENKVYFLANTNGWGKLTKNYKGDIEYNALFQYEALKNSVGGDSMKWTDLSQNLPNSGGPFERWNVQGSYDMFVKVHPADSNAVFIGGTNIYRSTSGFKDSVSTKMIGGYMKGAKFPDVGVWPNNHPDQHQMVFYKSNPNKMLNANDGGVFRANDALKDSMVWESLNQGYLTTQFYTVTLDHGTNMSPILVGGAQDNNQLMTNSEDGKKPWETVYFGDGSYAAIENGAKHFYFSKQQGKMIKATVNNQLQRTAYRRIDPIGGKNYQFINQYFLDPNNQNTMYLAGGKYLWRNDQLDKIVLDGKNDSIALGWTRGSDSVPVPNMTITALHVCKTPVNRVYYGTSSKRVYRVDSANNGTMKPIDITVNSALPSGSVSCMAADPTNGDKVILTYSNYGIYSLFYSENAGKTWQKIGGNLEQNTAGTGNGPSIRWASIMPVENGKIYLVATSVGLFATDTLMGLNTVWVQQASGEIGNMVCDMIDVRLSDGTVALATHGNGIYSARLFDKTDILNTRSINKVNVKVYPNPVNEKLTIELSERKPVKMVSILDELGRVVFSNSNDKELGELMRFDLSKLEVGIYYVRVEFNTGEYSSNLIYKD